MPEGGKRAKVGTTGDQEVHTSPARMLRTPPNSLASEPMSAPPYLAVSANSAQRAPSHQVAAQLPEQPPAAAERGVSGRVAGATALATWDNAFQYQSHAAGGQQAGLPSHCSAQQRKGTMTSAPSQLGNLQRTNLGALPRIPHWGAGPRTRGGCSNAAPSLRLHRTEGARGQAAGDGPHRSAAPTDENDAATRAESAAAAGATYARSGTTSGCPAEKRADARLPAKVRTQANTERPDAGISAQPVTLALPPCERCGTGLTRLCGGLGLFTCTHCGRRRSRQQTRCAVLPLAMFSSES